MKLCHDCKCTDEGTPGKEARIDRQPAAQRCGTCPCGAGCRRRCGENSHECPPSCHNTTFGSLDEEREKLTAILKVCEGKLTGIMPFAAPVNDPDTLKELRRWDLIFITQYLAHAVCGCFPSLRRPPACWRWRWMTLLSWQRGGSPANGSL